MPYFINSFWFNITNRFRSTLLFTICIEPVDTRQLGWSQFMNCRNERTMPAFIKRTLLLNLNTTYVGHSGCLVGSCTLLSLDFKCIEFIVISPHDWTSYAGALDVTVNKCESTYLSNKISVGAAHRHSGFRISGKFSSVMFHLSRDQVRQLLTSTMTLASSAGMATPLSCKTHDHVFQYFTSTTPSQFKWKKKYIEKKCEYYL